MSLSMNLAKEFVEVTNDSKKPTSDNVVYGTIVEYNGEMYAKIDGSPDNVLTPISTTASLKVGERVIVTLKNHTATVTGNMSDPSASSSNVKEIGTRVEEFEVIVADKANIVDLSAESARIDTLVADNVAINAKLTAYNADIEKLEADTAIISGQLIAVEADIDTIQADYVEINQKLSAAEADIDVLQADNVTINEKLTANEVDISTLKVDNEAIIERLIANSVKIDEADIKYVNIDFSNIDKAWMDEFYAKSGLIENVTMEDGTVTGHLVGVTITGDLIQGNTIVADKLVIRGEDGILYKLNTTGNPIHTLATMPGYFHGDDIDIDQTDSITSVIESESDEGWLVTLSSDRTLIFPFTSFDESILDILVVDNLIQYKRSRLEGITECVILKGEETDYNSLNGKVIAAKSITATQISVSDLVAFDATIGGFNITDNAIYSEVKDSEGNTTRGIYLDKDGQVNIGDGNNFIKYIRDEEGNYRLSISAADIYFQLNGENHSIADIGQLGEYVYIGRDENDQPYIELGESDSNFKLKITNTQIQFMEGSTVPAYITNQALNIDKAIVENELQMGDESKQSGVYVWKIRSNGNLGLMWKEVTN